MSRWRHISRLLIAVGVIAVILASSHLPVSAQDEVADSDRDGDGVDDWDDRFPDDPTETIDTDWDGVGDNADHDDDGDGVPDDEDDFPLDENETTDSDGDGIGDVQEENEAWSARRFRDNVRDSGLDDADGDGRWDAVLEDTDGDGYVDLIDPVRDRAPGPACPQGDPLFSVAGPDESDFDFDGVPDSEDQDINNDGVVTADEIETLNYLADTDQDGITDSEDDDLDGDGYPNTEDMFPYDDREWADYNCGGLGDNVDPDADGDFVMDDIDAFPNNGHEWADRDGDGIGDTIDADDDNDGLLDSVDEFPYDADESVDSDHDGVGDSADSDDDDDGVPDVDDAFPLDRYESEPLEEQLFADELSDVDGLSSSGASWSLAFSEPIEQSQPVRRLLILPLLVLAYVVRRATHE